MGLYEQIRDIAKAKGYSINRLERELGFARSSINKFNTNTPSVDKISQIADFLGVSVEYLMTGTESDQQEIKMKPGVNIVNENGNVQTFDMNSIIYCIVESILQMPPEKQEMVNDMVGGKKRKKKVIYVENPNDRKKPPHLMPNAAHTRTDIPVTDADIKHDEDIMDDENF